MDKAVDHKQQQGNSQILDVVGIPGAGAVCEQEHDHKSDEPSPPDRNRRGIQNYVRVGQDARHQHLLYCFYPELQQVKAPNPESGTWMRSGIAERMPTSTAAQSSEANKLQGTAIIQGISEHNLPVGMGKSFPANRE